ncbi:MAG TPA: MYXO-CTERM sorting domain-containing protein, partial [Polyangiaceae bacterium]|nr:MYXO-CTERM sorting domain-containing protein [Polyangiaceae bacterium]
VRITHSGRNTIGSGGPLSEGDAVVNAEVSGSLSGQIAPLLDPTQCDDVPCGGALADANGVATFIVPVVGSQPNINLQASYSVEAEGTTHYYDGSITVTGCANGEASIGVVVQGDAGGQADAGTMGGIELVTNHAELSGLGDFIAALGDGPAVPGSGNGGPNIPNPIDDVEVEKPKCGCTTGPRPTSPLALLFALGLVGATALRRRSS